MSKFMKHSWKLVMALLLVLTACTKPYNPPAITSVTNYLVVEGVINPGSDSTVINLSRTTSLANPVTEAPELNATVSVENNQNNTYPLISAGNGRYISAPLNSNSTNQYRLRIIRSNGEVYLSDFLQVKNSPPIDTINYAVQGNNVNISLKTHDPANNSRYYRWDYTETFIFHTYFDSQYTHIKNPRDTIVRAIGINQDYICWHTDTGTNILLNSSVKLSQDVITNQPVNTVPDNDEKFSVMYSIQVNQYVLTPDAFSYWTQLKTNTQQLGSIFDAQPTVLVSNIHCVTKPAETVLGYLSAGTVAHKRIFIGTQALPIVSGYTNPYSGCPLDSSIYANYADGSVGYYLYSNIYAPFMGVSSGSVLLGFKSYPRYCADCRTRGTNFKPSYWP